MTPRILIIAGSDSGGGAGIQADIKTVTMLGGHAMTAITAITAQNTLGVQAVLPVPAGMVVAQINSVVTDIGVDAVKIGMIGSAETANAVADVLEHLSSPSPSGEGLGWGSAAGDGLGETSPTPTPPLKGRGKRIPIVFDPVMVATSGDTLADTETIAAFERLMKLATVVTPNIPELEALTQTLPVRPELVEGLSFSSASRTEGSASTSSARTDLAIAIARRFGCAVLVKGGHIEGERLIDRLVEANGSQTHWESERINTTSTHGTGCTLASAIATSLAFGKPLDVAVAHARRFVRTAILSAPGLGGGHGPMGHALGVVPFDEIEG